MDNQTDMFYEDEIDLREIFKAFSKHKKRFWSILGVGSFITAFLVLLSPRLYEANSMLLVTPLRVKMAVSGKLLENVLKNDKGVVDISPTISLETHQELLLSNSILNSLYNNLVERGIIKEDEYDIIGIRKMLEVKVKKDTDVISLQVHAPRDDLAIAIANEWASIYMKYNQDLLLGEFKGARDFISEQFEAARRNYLAVKDRIEAFDVREGLISIENEYNTKKEKMEKYLQEVTDLSIQLELKKKQLAVARKRLSALEKGGKWVGLLAVEKGPENLRDLKDMGEAVVEVKKELQAAIGKLTELKNKYPVSVMHDELNKSKEDLARAFMLEKSLRSQVLNIREDLANDEKLNKFVSIGLMLPEQISSTDLWKMLSLIEGYNFFATRYEMLLAKISDLRDTINELRDKIKDAQNLLPEYELEVDVLSSSYEKFKKEYANAKGEVWECSLEISKIKPKIEYLEALSEKLRREIEDLNSKLVEKKHKKAKLRDDFELYQSTYREWANRLVETRIAKAMQLGDVKLVSRAIGAEGKRIFGRAKAAVSILLFLFFAIMYVFVKEALGEGGDSSDGK